MAEGKPTWLAFTLSRWLLIGLLANIAAVISFAWFAGEMLEGDTLRLDESVRRSIYQPASPVLTRVMQAVTFLGSGLFLLCLGTVISIAFLLSKRWRALLLFLMSMAGATTLNLTLKASFRRTRPSSFFDTPLPSSFSFPSGHALLSLCFYCAIAYLISLRFNNPAIRLSVWGTAIILISAIGFSRIYLGVHYLSDVIAGYMAGIFWIVTVILLDRVLLYERIPG